MAIDLDLNVEFDEKTLTRTEGKFNVQPLDRGYGVTLGSALRRVLLTCIPGAAITNIKMDGVLHEFSTIKGVKDDVMDIIQNLKGVRFRLKDNNPDKVIMKLKGKSTVTGAHIQKASDQFEVLNPDHYITEVGSKGKLDMELRIGVGRGYVPADENDLPNAPIGMIAVDSIFNPVTKVTFDVRPVPGAKDPIEILEMKVHTDGSITAKDAVSYASSVLIEHLKMIEAISKPDVLEVTEGVSEEVLKIRELLKRTIDEMELSVRSHNCLQAAGIKFIYELVSKEESEMLKYKNFGRKSLTELVEKLDQMGLHFGMDLDVYMREDV